MFEKKVIIKTKRGKKMLIEEALELEEEKEVEEIPSFIHSYLCGEIMEQLAQNKQFKAFPELTLAIDSGLTPDISIYPRQKERPDFFRDISKFPDMPVVAIEIISSSQNIQDLLEKAEKLIQNNVKAVWTVEPFTNTVFVTTKDGEKRFHNTEIESEGIKVDFKQIFGTN
jgi:Uma2 family endonuclease